MLKKAGSAKIESREKNRLRCLVQSETLVFVRKNWIEGRRVDESTTDDYGRRACNAAVESVDHSWKHVEKGQVGVDSLRERKTRESCLSANSRKKWEVSIQEEHRVKSINYERNVQRTNEILTSVFFSFSSPAVEWVRERRGIDQRKKGIEDRRAATRNIHAFGLAGFLGFGLLRGVDISERHFDFSEDSSISPGFSWQEARSARGGKSGIWAILNMWDCTL